MGDDIPFTNFLNLHKHQLVLSDVPELFWRTLFNKLTAQVLDANESFSIVQFENETNFEDLSDKVNTDTRPTRLSKVYVSCENGVNKDDIEHIYLIDHAWTFNPISAKEHLLTVPGLLDRMCNLMGINSSKINKVDGVLKEMWKYNQTYSISSHANIEDRLPVWYVMDEFGSSIQHSDNPNFRVVPFAYVSEGITYSIMFPVKDVAKDKEVTRDYAVGFTDTSMRKALLLPWIPADFKNLSFTQDEPPVSYFTSGHMNEILPDLSALSNKHLPTYPVLKVYSDYAFINKYLTDNRFQIVDNDKEADILWYTSHFTDFEKLSLESPNKFINQFPYEFVITVKDLLSIVCRRACTTAKTYDEQTLDIFPLWLPTTFNLNTELDKFISYFQWREDKNLDNHWICKPWNLARGLDTNITNNLNCIVRLPNSGPKIAQKYLNNPVLFLREDVMEGSGLVKFDIRYVLLLKSVKPLEVYAYRRFFLRFANKSFDLSDFDDYEKHFTVMNYNEQTQLHRKLCDDFVKEFEMQYPSINWSNVEGKIFKMFKEMFEAAVAKEPPCGIGHSPQSRALYAADIMLSYLPQDICIEPQLLEVNWIPDCERACLYYEDFYNDIFSLLFLNETKNVFYQL